MKSNQSFHYVSIDDISFIEKVSRKSIFYTNDGQFETSYSLQEIEAKLPKYFLDRFLVLRIRASPLVSTNR
ncbi:LytTR family transcriptional regulator DNA-binding domain-containing protein [Pseudoneobacillus sp. C159]